METTSRATTTLLSLTCSDGWLAQGRALAADQTCWSGCRIVDCILPTSQPAMAGYCSRRLAGGCGFVVAVGYASVSPQAGTNLHSAAILPWSAFTVLEDPTCHRCSPISAQPGSPRAADA